VFARVAELFFRRTPPQQPWSGAGGDSRQENVSMSVPGDIESIRTNRKGKQAGQVFMSGALAWVGLSLSSTVRGVGSSWVQASG